MKRIFLLAIAALMLNTFTFAQVTITDWDGNDMSASTFELPIINIGQSGFHFVVTNTGTSDLNYKLKVLQYSSPADAIGISVCANGNCVFINSQPMYVGQPTLLVPGDSFGEENGGEIAYAGYTPDGSVGPASVTMQIVDAVTDAVLVEFSMETATVGVDNIIENLKLSAYPNPTSGLVTFLYDSKYSDGQIVLKNIIGKSVATINLAKNSSKTSFSTSNLPSGIYLYSLISKGEVVNTKKIIVK